MSSEYLTTKELAELLRIKERKVYDLAASGDVPCSKALGKLLFPRGAIDAWLARNSSGMGLASPVALPNVVLGSHDPLLDWALRESGSGLAAFFDGSGDGLDRFARNEGVASGLHILDPGTNIWNEGEIRHRFAQRPVVLVAFARRQRGLIVSARARTSIKRLTDAKGRRLVPRQPGAGAQTVLEILLKRDGMSMADFKTTTPARTETDAAAIVLEGKADVALGLQSSAAQHRLGFVPLIEERFDLLVDRRSWFEPPMQRLLAFAHSKVFAARAAELGGYDVSELGTVRFNGS